MQTLLIYPHLLLFAYNLEEKSDGKEISQPKSWEALRTRLKVPPEADFNSERNYPFAVDDVHGFYQRISLGETDSLLVSTFIKDEDKPQDVSCFYKFRQKLELQANVGRTWLILGYLNSASDADREKAAKEAYKALNGIQQEPKLKQGNYFLGSTIFEALQPQDLTKLENNDFILICICPYKKTMERIATFYYEWLWLFYYRHKILCTYSNSRIVKKLLETEGLFPSRSTIPEIQFYLPDLNLANLYLEQIKIDLHKNLLMLSKQTAGLESLALQLQTLKTNMKNYKNRLEKIKEIANNEIGLTKLNFLEEFGEAVASKYQGEIEQDYTSLSPGLRIREKYIDTIRGIMEVSQAERDRTLTNTIAIVGIAVASSTITTTILSTQLPQPQPKNSISLTIAFCLSISAAIIPAAIAFILLRKFRRK